MVEASHNQPYVFKAVYETADAWLRRQDILGEAVEWCRNELPTVATGFESLDGINDIHDFQLVKFQLTGKRDFDYPLVRARRWRYDSYCVRFRDQDDALRFKLRWC